jgi:hypothetical protein
LQGSDACLALTLQAQGLYESADPTARSVGQGADAPHFLMGARRGRGDHK